MKPTDHPTHAPLSSLSIDEEANVRRTGRGPEPEYTASIQAKGVIEPLIVRRNGKGYTVTNGGKRLDALRFLLKKSLTIDGVKVTDDYPVPILVRDEADAAARETSLMTALVRSDIHPVDEFEAFATLVRDGMTVDQVAERFAMDVRDVRQSLSLAGLAPEIRTAWRDGKIGGPAAEAFAQTKDLEHQVRVFDKLKSRASSEWEVNAAIAGSRDVGLLLKFVGAKAYEAAGHHINRSLFDDDERETTLTVDDVPALKAMVSAKIAAEVERLRKDGWDWVVAKDEAPKDVMAWRRLPPVTPTKEQKAHAGCTVGVTWDGKLDVQRGYIKPGEKVRVEKTPAQKAASTKAKATKDESSGISAALALRLSQQITLAAADALVKDPWLTIRFAIATLAAAGDGPMRLRMSGMAEAKPDEYDFAKYYKLASGKKPAELPAMLAAWLVKALDFQAHSADRLPLAGKNECGALVLNEINGEELNAAMRRHFDPADYFASVNKELIAQAVNEAMNKKGENDLPDKIMKMTKANAVSFAVAHVAKTKWLPPEMRTKSYDGPKGAAGKGARK